MTRYIYEVIIRPDEGGRGFCVTVPDLDGCLRKEPLEEASCFCRCIGNLCGGFSLMGNHSAPPLAIGSKGGKVVG